MKKEIADYIHLYKDAKIIHDKYPDTQMTIHNWDKNGDVVMGKSDEFQELKPHHKLVLRPLSDMTEEEAIELVKISEWKQYGDHPHKREYKAYRNGFNEIVVSWGDSIREKNVPETKEVFGFEEFRYLLSKGFDVFNLIPDGLAIDKTKTQPNDTASR